MRLTKLERAVINLMDDAWYNVPSNAIEQMWTKPGGGESTVLLRQHFSNYEFPLQEILMEQIRVSGRSMFDEIGRDVKVEWSELKKDVTIGVPGGPPELPETVYQNYAFNEASPTATAYARQQSMRMMADLASSTQLGVQQIILSAFTDGLTRRQVTKPIIELLQATGGPGIGPYRTLYGAFGTATNGLTERYAVAVYHRAEKLVESNPNITFDALKKKVSTYGARLRRSRARTIARTEIMRASNHGRLMAMEQAMDNGLVNPSTARKQWSTSRFDVCQICVPLHGQTQPARGGLFLANNGWSGASPPAHPNCRCVVRLLPAPNMYGTPSPTYGDVPYTSGSVPMGLDPARRVSPSGFRYEAKPLGIDKPYPAELVPEDHLVGMAAVRSKEVIRFPRPGSDTQYGPQMVLTPDDFPATLSGKELATGNFRGWPDSDGRQDWLTDVKPMKLRQSHDMDLYEAIKRDGIGMPVEVMVGGDGTMFVSSGAHRVAIAEELGLEVPIRYYGTGYERAMGRQSNFSHDEWTRLKDRFPQRGHVGGAYSEFL